MIRYFLAKGDRAGSATIIEGLPTVTCSNPPPRVEIATLDMKTYCTACKREGFIAPKGPRWPGMGPNGKQWALSGDINVCGCNPSPVFYAERGMKMTFKCEPPAAPATDYVNAGSPGSSTEDADDDLECYFEIVESTSQAPVEGMAYRLSSDGRALVHDAALEGGRTRAFSVKDHPKLAVVAWHQGEVR